MDRRITIQNVSTAVITVLVGGTVVRLLPGQVHETSHAEYASPQIRNLVARGIVSVRVVERRITDWDNIAYKEDSEPPPPVYEGDATVFYDGYDGTPERQFSIQNVSGAWRNVEVTPQHSRIKFIAWHRGARKWVVGYRDYADAELCGVYVSTDAHFPGACPGPGWNKPTIPRIGAYPPVFDYGLNGNEQYSHPWCDMPDGGIAFTMRDPADAQLHLYVLSADGSTVTSPALFPFSYVETTRLVAPRGSSRLFAVDAYNYYTAASGYYSDPPYTTWHACYGLGVNGAWHANINHVLLRANGQLVMLRGWMRYGPNSGSQDEIWTSDDNGVNWALSARPWGTYGSMPIDARDAYVPRKIGNRWAWVTYGDSARPIFITTTDFLTFASTVFNPGANFPFYIVPDPSVTDRGWGFGEVAETGGWFSGDFAVTPYLVDQSTGLVIYDSRIPPFDTNPTAADVLRHAVHRDERPWSAELP